MRNSGKDQKITRRDALRGAGAAAVGAAAVAGLASSDQSAPQAPTAASPPWQVGEVTAVREGQVMVKDVDGWLTLDGFPDGWRALAGDKVAVGRSDTGGALSATPVNRWVTAAAAPRDLHPGSRIGGANGPQIVAATLITAGLADQRRAGVGTELRLRFAVADRMTRDGAERIFAIREV